MKSERELNLCTLVLEECLINKSKSEVSDREMQFIDGAITAFKNLDIFSSDILSNDFNTNFDNSSFPAVVYALFKYNSGKDAMDVVKSLLKVTDEYAQNKLDRETQDYSKTIDFLKTVNSMYKQKTSSNMSPKSIEQNVF